jgi:hypothetical protein
LAFEFGQRLVQGQDIELRPAFGRGAIRYLLAAASACIPTVFVPSALHWEELFSRLRIALIDRGEKVCHVAHR